MENATLMQVENTYSKLVFNSDIHEATGSVNRAVDCHVNNAIDFWCQLLSVKVEHTCLKINVNVGQSYKKSLTVKLRMNWLASRNTMLLAQ